MEATSPGLVARVPLVGTRPLSTRALLLRAQREAFEYFRREVNPSRRWAWRSPATPWRWSGA
jgi:hypothetical protein